MIATWRDLTDHHPGHRVIFDDEKACCALCGEVLSTPEAHGDERFNVLRQYYAAVHASVLWGNVKKAFPAPEPVEAGADG